MKFKTKELGIASGLAASALLVSSHNDTEKADLIPVNGSNSVQAFGERMMVPGQIETEDGGHQVLTIKIPSELEWNEASTAQFSHLAGKLAIQGKLSESENQEYAELKTLRRRTHPSRSYDEIVADQELHRKVSEAINSLKTLVEYAVTTYPSAIRENRT